MTLIADGMLVLAALAASLYCWVLSRRLRNLSQLDQGLGAAISSLSQQVEEMEAALNTSKAAIDERSAELKLLARASEQAAERLEKLVEAARAIDVPPPAASARGAELLSVSRKSNEARGAPATEPVTSLPESLESATAEFGAEALENLIAKSREAADAADRPGMERVLRALKLKEGGL